MKRFGLLFLALVACICAFSTKGADAVLYTKAYKVISINFTVTPSPVAYRPMVKPKAAFNVASLVANPFTGPRQMASISTFDVGPVTIAQAQPQGAIPVQFVAKADPNAAYIKIIPHNTSLMAVYGSNTYTCPFEVFGFYPSAAWKMVDWGFGTVPSGSGPYPIENQPTSSYLAWSVETVSTGFTNYYNGGSPGETSFVGTANVSQQHCIDLQLTVPASLAPGTYTAVLQYTLQFV